MHRGARLQAIRGSGHPWTHEPSSLSVTRQKQDAVSSSAPSAHVQPTGVRDSKPIWASRNPLVRVTMPIGAMSRTTGFAVSKPIGEKVQPIGVQVSRPIGVSLAVIISPVRTYKLRMWSHVPGVVRNLFAQLGNQHAYQHITRIIIVCPLCEKVCQFTFTMFLKF